MSLWLLRRTRMLACLYFGGKVHEHTCLVKKGNVNISLLCWLRTWILTCLYDYEKGHEC